MSEPWYQKTNMNEMEQILKRLERIDDKMDGVSLRVEFCAGQLSEVKNDTAELKEEQKQNSKEHKEFQMCLSKHNEQLKNIKEAESKKEQKKATNVGLLVAIGLGVIGFIGTVLGYFV